MHARTLHARFQLLSSATRTHLHRSLPPQVYKAVLLLSNTFGEAEKLRCLVQDHMIAEKGKVSGITSNCPTRFAVRHFICQDVKFNERALRSACGSAEWAAAAVTSSHGDAFRDIVQEHSRGGGRRAADPHLFWTELPILIDLVQPFSDAIHKMEADKPMLSQVTPIWQALEEHVDAFVVKHPDEKFKCLPSMLKRRRDKHCPDAAYAAVALDPCYFVQEESGEWSAAIITMDPDELERVEKYCERFVASDEIAALRKELAMLRLAPLPKQFNCLYEVCADRREEDGKIFLMTADQRRGLWTRNLAKAGFPLLALCADRLLSMHATSTASERNWSVWGQIYTKYKTRLGLVKGGKIVYIRGNSKIVEGEDNELEEICLQVVD